MAKLQNLRPRDSKVSFRFSIATTNGNIGLSDVMEEIVKHITGKDTATSKDSAFFFRFKTVAFDVKDPNAQTVVTIFGRQYETVNRSNNAGYDAVLKPEPTEFWGLWHDSNILNTIMYHGNSTPQVIPVAVGQTVPLTGTASEDFVCTFVVEYVRKAQ